MRLSDAGNGVSRDSVEFYREHRHELGEITEVTVRFPGYDDPHDPYLLRLRDSVGNEMRLSGCTTGYVGDGPNATMRLLIHEGCPVADAALLLRAATATFSRDANGWRVNGYTLADAPGSQPVAFDARCELLPEQTLG